MRLDHFVQEKDLGEAEKQWLRKIIRFWNDHNDGTRSWDVLAANLILLTGAISFSTRAITANYTLTSGDSVLFVDSTSGALTVTLPTAVAVKGRYYVVTVTAGGNLVTIATTLSQTINGASTFGLPGQYHTAKVVSDGSNWFLI